MTYATIACVRRDGRYSRRPPRRQNSSETILPPPPSFYSADHPLIVSFQCEVLCFELNQCILKSTKLKDIESLLLFCRTTTNLQRKNVVKVTSVDQIKVVELWDGLLSRMFLLVILRLRISALVLPITPIKGKFVEVKVV